MPKITIDGKELEFKEGQTVIEVARENGIYIPHFCWHPELSISGNCRMCLTEIEKIPKLAIACSTYAADGMVVKTQTPQVVKAREAVMEFILINHPLDCPICDEAGECKLQDYAFRYSRGESRMVEEKQHKPKRVPLGPRVLYDAERCIMCSRCIRFSDEVAQNPQLTFVQRGDRTFVSTFPEEEFDDPYSMNTVDICPVGALTSRDFRFKSRVWEMSATPSVCIGCSRGCNINVWVRDNTIQRLTPRENLNVNKYWMCDYGRTKTFKFVNSDTRVDGPMIKNENSLIKTDWEEALNLIASSLKKFRSEEIAFIASPFATLEDNYAFTQLARLLNVKYYSTFNYTIPGSGDNILITEDKSPNKAGLRLVELTGKGVSGNLEEIFEKIKLGEIKAVYILEQAHDFDSYLIDALGKAEFVAVHATNFNRLTEFADVVLPASTFAEKHGTFVNIEGVLQRIKPAVATLEADRALGGFENSRWDKFGTKFDRWAQGKKYDAKPSWKIINLLSGKFAKPFGFNISEDVFVELAGKTDTLKGIDYNDIGADGIKVIENKVSEEKI